MHGFLDSWCGAEAHTFVPQSTTLVFFLSSSCSVMGALLQSPPKAEID